MVVRSQDNYEGGRGALDRTRKSHDVIENIGGHFGSSAKLSFALGIRVPISANQNGMGMGTRTLGVEYSSWSF